MTLQTAEHYGWIALLVLKGIQQGMALIIGAGWSPPWLMKLKAGIDDVSINIPTSWFQKPPVIGAPVK